MRGREVGRERQCTASSPVHGVNGRYTSLNHLLRVDTRPGIDGLTWKEEGRY